MEPDKPAGRLASAIISTLTWGRAAVGLALILGFYALIVRGLLWLFIG